MPISALVDRWLPAELRTTPDVRLRATVALVFPLFNVVFTSLSGFFFVLTGDRAAGLGTFATLPLVGASVVLLLRTRSLAASAHATTAVSLALTFGVSIAHGGADWRSLVWVGPSLLAALLVGGRRTALTWFAIAMCGLVGLLAFDLTGPRNLVFFEAFGLVLLTVAVFSVAALHHRVNELILADLDRTTRALDEAQRVAAVGSWQADVATSRVQWSKTLVELVRPPAPPRTLEEAFGVFHPEDRLRVTALYTSLLAHGDRGAVDARVVRGDGAVRTLHWIFHPTRDAEGRLTAVSGTARDVTEDRAAEAELIRAREQAIYASAAKSQFLSHMSHEIRTPMNGIVGLTTLALGGRLDPEQREYVEGARTAGLRLLTIIGDILDLAKVEAGELAVERAPFSLGTVLAEVLATVSPMARDKGLQLTLDASPTIGDAVVGDAIRLRQILVNLVGNAVKFTSRGEVRIAAAPAPELPDAVRFTVTDTGPGIAPEARARIFEPFQQADASTTRRFGGTGLGLSISRKLCELMRGELWVESEVGVGSRFFLQLPLPPAVAAPVAVPPAVEPEPEVVRPLFVLLAEDCPVNARVATRLLERAGHRVVRVSTGLDAVNAARAEPVDVVLMDLQMPELDGLEATRRIRAWEAIAGGHVPIVALTANAMTGDDAACLEAGMDAYLSKPVDAALLVRTVRETAERVGSRAA